MSAPPGKAVFLSYALRIVAIVGNAAEHATAITMR